MNVNQGRGMDDVELAAEAKQELGEPVEPYHAGMSADQRTAVQNRFMAGLTRIVAATTAFGMGIDKPDIRAVIHVGVPYALATFRGIPILSPAQFLARVE